MSSIRALIVDDEAAARRRIKQLLCEQPGVEVVGECEDGPEAVAMTRAHSPDLLFLDVQMPGMSGFDVIREIGPERAPAVVFVTAFDQFALRAFDVHALDYLLKPFDRERFRRAVERAREQVSNAQAAALGLRLQGLLKDLGAAGRYAARLEVKKGGRTIFVPTEDVDWVAAADNYLELHVGRETHLIRETMAQLEGRLDPSSFVRIHRSALVNVERVKDLRPLFNKDHVLTMRDGTQLTVSRTRYDKLISLLRSN
jgi:two-component system, LytTR family, response regulator